MYSPHPSPPTITNPWKSRSHTAISNQIKYIDRPAFACLSLSFFLLSPFIPDNLCWKTLLYCSGSVTLQIDPLFSNIYFNHNFLIKFRHLAKSDIVSSEQRYYLIMTVNDAFPICSWNRGMRRRLLQRAKLCYFWANMCYLLEKYVLF